MNAPVPVIIDCDPGVDDAVMLMMALASPALEVTAVTTVAGNVPLALTTRNAGMILELMGRSDVPLHAGCPRPMQRAPVTAEDFHGETGIAGLTPFTPATPPRETHAVIALIERLQAVPPASLTLVVTGPMTNLAAALVLAPECARGIASLIVMAGATTEGGNITPFAEYNIFADPHAAATVFDANLRTTVLSLDVTHTIRATPPRLAQIRDIGGPRAVMMAGLLEAANTLEQRWKPGQSTPMHDPATIAFLLAPHLFTTRPCRVSVDLSPGERFGQTVVTGDPQGRHHWVTSGDGVGMFALIEALLSR